MVIFESVFLWSLKVCVTGIECVCVWHAGDSAAGELLTEEPVPMCMLFGSHPCKDNRLEVTVSEFGH